MSPPKRNEFLDASDSEDDHAVDDLSSDDDIAKGGRAPKRRKLDSHRDDEAESDASEPEGDDSEPEEDAGEPEDVAGGPQDVSRVSKEDADEHHPKALDGQEAAKAKNTTTKVKRSIPKPEPDLVDVTKPTRKNLVVSDKAIKKSGVIFVSRVPPFMKPAKLRSLLEPYGTINRMFLAPEDPAARTRRVRAGGNKKCLYTEGWVEFVRKKDAKAACELLNAQIIGGKKRSYYHDDIWNLVYLRGFKWHHLTQQIAAENAERASRMRAEIGKATRENKAFVRNVEMAKMMDGMQAKAKKKRRGAGDGGGDGGGDGDDAGASTHPERARTFKQVPGVKKPADGEEQPEHVTRVLSKIF